MILDLVRMLGPGLTLLLVSVVSLVSGVLGLWLTATLSRKFMRDRPPSGTVKP